MSTADTVVHIVDDEEVVRNSLAFLLSSAGFAVRVHESATAFLQLAANIRNGCLITDLRMPEESGMSLIKRLREHTSRQHLPVIVTSGHADMEDVSDMLRLQVLDLFRKPIYHVRLLETLDNLFPKP